MSNHYRFIARFSLLAAILILQGCGALLPKSIETAPTPTIETMPEPIVAAPAPKSAASIVATKPRPVVPKQSPTPSAKPKLEARNTGRYFQFDGPGEIAPEQLENIAEPKPRDEPLATFANRRYVVFGRAYTPQTERKVQREVGFASWYGRQFHGRKTATGDQYDMYAMTAAHPTLPLPSYVRVTNLANQRSVIVRVNDRGPFLNNRIIDLSYAAAAKLGYARQGSTRVAVETLLPAGPLDQPSNLIVAAAPRVDQRGHTVAVSDIGSGLRLKE
jgi:rare lipoprotein A (peptidoglycan hydrolase)